MKLSRNYKILILIIILSFIVKLIFLNVSGNLQLFGDEADYNQSAINLIETSNFDILRPPLYISFLSSVYYFFGNQVMAAKFFQIIISLISIFLLFKIGSMVFDERVGLIASGIFAFYPVLIAFTHYLWSETLFILFLLLSIYLLLLFLKQNKMSFLIISAILLGLSVLIRSNMLTFIPFLALFFFWPRKSKLPRKRMILAGIIFIVLAMGTVSVWTARDYVAYNEFIVVDINLGNAFYAANHKWHTPVGIDVEACRFKWKPDKDTTCNSNGLNDNDTISEKISEYKCQVKDGVSYMLDHPGEKLYHAPFHFASLFSPGSFLTRHMLLGIYGNVEENKVQFSVIAMLALLSYLFVMFFAIYGLFISKMESFKIYTLLLFANIALSFSFFVGITRYTLPLIPLFMVYTAYGLTKIKTIKEFIKTRKAIAFFITLAVFAIIQLIFLVPCYSPFF